jgi:hypothetical protein
MARRRAGGGVAQPVAHRRQLADGGLQLVRLGGEQVAIDARPPVGRKHARDLVEREAGCAAERDEREALEHVRAVNPAQAVPAGRGDQALFLVEAQGRGGHARAPRYV